MYIIQQTNVFRRLITNVTELMSILFTWLAPLSKHITHLVYPYSYEIWKRHITTTQSLFLLQLVKPRKDIYGYRDNVHLFKGIQDTFEHFELNFRDKGIQRFLDFRDTCSKCY